EIAPPPPQPMVYMDIPDTTLFQQIQNVTSADVNLPVAAFEISYNRLNVNPPPVLANAADWDDATVYF
ncbi:hypothetical protein Tco_1308726, partial [Tanacetum coccineum]